MDSSVLQNIKGSKTKKHNIWLMRQAVRYMQEYQIIKSKFSGFMEMCKNTEAVSEITLQPINRFDFDAAIIFSDILIILDALNIDVNFIKDYGPVIQKPESLNDILNLPTKLDQDIVEPCYKAISIVKKELKNKPLIGFSAAPWTLAAYFLEGKLSKDLSVARKFSYEHVNEMKFLIELLTNLIIEHLKNQIESGVDSVQIFDTHAYHLDCNLHRKFSLDQVKKISIEIKKFNNDIPITFYTKSNLINEKNFIENYIDCISFNSNIDMTTADKNLSEKLCFQGNLDPMILLVGGQLMKKAAKDILIGMKNRKFIFNLGHGVLPQTPTENVEELVKLVKNFRY